MAARKRDWAFIGGVITCAACVVTLGVAGVVATRGHDGQAVRAGSLVREHVTPAGAEPGTTNGWTADQAWDYVRRELPC